MLKSVSGMAHPFLQFGLGFPLLLIMTGLLAGRLTVNAFFNTPSQPLKLWFLKSKLKAIELELSDHFRFQADLPYVIQRVVEVFTTLAAGAVGIALLLGHSAWQFFGGGHSGRYGAQYVVRLITGNFKMGVLDWIGLTIVYCTLVILTTQIWRLYNSLVDPAKLQLKLESKADALALKLGIARVDTDRWNPKNIEKFFDIRQP